jgi:ACS family tartrate transporter-like MFS transporter
VVTASGTNGALPVPAASGAQRSAEEHRIMSKVFRRLLPVLMICYFIAFLDRVNIGFAAVMLNRDLGFSASVYGFGAGIFFISYFLFEVPSNLALHRFGARTWIARIMLTWGVIAGATAFVVGQNSFYVVRFLLGAAEAGFFPGVVYYITLWLPSEYRARMIGIFYVASPVAIALGAVISAPLLMLDGVFGIPGWQWLFVAEAIPAIVMSVVFFLVMKDTPKDAGWLTADEKALLLARVEEDRRLNTPPARLTLGQVFVHPGIVWLSAVYFGMNLAGVGLAMFLPQIVAGFGAGVGWTGVVTSIPYFCAAVALPFWGRYSDRHAGSRQGHCATGAAALAIMLSLCVFTHSPWLMMLFICVAAVGVYAFATPFFTLSSTLLSGSAAAAGLAVINSVGNLSGFAGPFVMGWIRDSTGSFTIGLLAIAIGPAFAAIAMLTLRREQLQRKV